MRNFIAFLLAPLPGITIVLAYLIVSNALSLNSAEAFLTTFKTTSLATYITYAIGMIVILPVYFHLKEKKLINGINLILCGWIFGLLMGLLIMYMMDDTSFWILTGSLTGAFTGYFLSLLLPNQQELSKQAEQIAVKKANRKAIQFEIKKSLVAGFKK